MMERGEIWWASLEEPTGSEPGYSRPVTVISSNDFNRSNIKTVIVAAITSNMRLADAPGNFKLSGKGTGLTKDSVLNISQIMTFNKSFLSEKIGTLSKKQIFQLDDGLKLVLTI